MTRRTIFGWLLGVCLIGGAAACGRTPQDRAAKKLRVNFEEATIAEIHSAMRAGELSCRSLVAYYLERIETFDQPTGLNSLVVVNPEALKRAEELDQEFAQTGILRPLHGIPVIVKDNYETKDLQTTAGSHRP